MAQVMVIFKVMPNGTEVNLDNLEKEIKAAVNPERINREPIAFGLIALNVTTIMEDTEGQLETIENKLRTIDGVSEVEVIKITRTL
ncbi:MAG: elongation factor 1-beta [Candidatus Aenigmatarchaeota archaeon]|nr:elongation factor 1-beta [Candidatus Aenigmarchaeota archaeon]